MSRAEEPAQAGDRADLERFRTARRILVGILCVNLALATAKMAVGWIGGTLSVLADGFHSLTDSGSNVVGLVGIALARRPPDAEHPYGHRKLETLSALLIGGFLGLAAWELLRACLRRLLSGEGVAVGAFPLVLMAVAIPVSLAVSWYEGRRGGELGSEVLRADAAHTRSDAVTSLGVLVSLVAVRLGYPWMDAVGGVGVSLFIGYAAFRIAWESSQVLIDTAVVSPEAVRRLAVQVPQVESVHKVRSRGTTDAPHADLHVQLPAELRLDQAHLIGHRVAEKLREELGLRDIVVHVEPPEGHRTDWHPESEEDEERE